MKLLPAILLLLIALDADAQKKQGRAKLDSMIARLSALPDDTNKANLLGEISYAYAHIDPEEGVRMAQREMDLSQKIGWRKGVGLAHNDFGGNYINMSAYAQATEHFFQALHIFEELGEKARMGAALGNIGLIFIQQGNFPKALEYQLKQLKIVEEHQDKQRLPSVLANIGRVYREMGRFDEALAYFHRSLEMDEALGEREVAILTRGSIGNIYFDRKAYPEAMTWYHQAYREAKEIGSHQLIADNLGRIGRTHLYIARDSMAVPPDSLIPAGKAANLERAGAFAAQGLALAKEVNFVGGIKSISETLYQVYELTGRHKEALEAFLQFSAINDSIYNTENSTRIHDLESKRAIELKEKDVQIARLAVAKKRNERWFFIAGIVLLLGLVAILFRSYRRQQHSNELLTVEKKRSDDLLRNILPTEVAEELKEHGGAHARLYEEVSVLFTDFIDFTIITEQRTPQSLVSELNECFTAFDAIIGRHGLEKIKTIGDAYMAVCGLPLPRQDHAARTVRAAIEIRDFMATRRRTVRTFEIRIGINSGPVVAGIVGVKKFAYDIWGDTVNMAARMEQCGQAGKINLSQSTYEMVKADFPILPRGKIAVKNKGAVDMYFVDDLTTVKNGQAASAPARMDA